MGIFLLLGICPMYQSFCYSLFHRTQVGILNSSIDAKISSILLDAEDDILFGWILDHAHKIQEVILDLYNESEVMVN